jgi:signal transduction histidine kinase
MVTAKELADASKKAFQGGNFSEANTLMQQVRVAVSDEGPGIPEPFRDRIFEPFSQMDSSTSRQESGMGLGLYMAKTLIELHGGQLSFENEPQGGTTFTVELRQHLASPSR